MTWQWPTLRARAALWLLLAFAGVGLAQGLMVSWVHALRGAALTYPEVLLQLTGAITAWAALPVVQTVVLNAAPLARPKAGGFRWAALLAIHLAGYTNGDRPDRHGRRKKRPVIGRGVDEHSEPRRSERASFSVVVGDRF